MPVKTKVRRTQKERREESRTKVIEAATHLFATKGYTGTTMIEIGRTAGLSHGLVTYHFGSKRECIRAVLEDVRQKSIERRKAALQGKRGLSGLDVVCEQYLRGPSNRRLTTKAIYIAIIESVTATPELKDLTRKADQAFRDSIAWLIEEAIEDGEISSTINVQSQAVLIAGMLRGIVQQRMVNPSAVPIDQIVKVATRAVRASLGDFGQ